MRLSLAALALVAALLAGCAHSPGKPSGRMLVAASIAPLADFARQVGGDLVDVELIVPPGSNVHDFELQPQQMKLLSSASVLILNGINLEYWADKAVDAAENRDLIIVRTGDDLPAIDRNSDPDSPSGNPHVWLDPVYAIHQVEMIRDAFIKADPRHRSEYAANTARYVAKLNRLDLDIRARVKTFRSRSFITFHPSWVYFARRYGLTEAAAIETSPGREPSPPEIAKIVDLARSLKARAIFAEPQFSPKAAQVVADEAGAKVLIIDPMGKPPDYDYISTMYRNLDQFSEALK